MQWKIDYYYNEEYQKAKMLLSWKIILLCLPLFTKCQDATTQAAVGPTGAGPVQPTAAVVQENATSATNSTSSPAAATPSPSSATTVAPKTSISSNSTSPNATATATTNATTEPVIELHTVGESSLPTEDTVTDNLTTGTPPPEEGTDAVPAYFEMCPSGLPCDQLSADCLNCSFDYSCVYGRDYNTTCMLKEGLDCIGSLPLEKTYQCRYCYQTEKWQQSCTPASHCQVNACPKQYILVNCTVNEDVICLGSRTFHRRKECNWTSGYNWTMALAFSIAFGGFGVDRFYLGYWQSGLGKLFSFGGAGVWTLIDVLLIAVGYITPSDGSHYIY